MIRLLLSALVLLLPLQTFAATGSSSSFFAERGLLISTSSPGNVYGAGATVAVTTPVTEDLSLLGGSVVVTGPVGGDATIAGGSVSVRAPIQGDARVLGGSVLFEAPISGDLFALGGSVSMLGGGAKRVLVIGMNVTVSGGADGPVTIYGNNVALQGAFASNVRVVASGRVSVKEGTAIARGLFYESPERARVAASTTVAGGVHYSGPSYLPTSEQTHALALASFGVFLFIRFLAAIILAGLIAGLFPGFSGAVAKRVFERGVRSPLLALLLGFAIIVAAPVLIFLLALTFVGMGIAFLAGMLYLVLTLLASIFAGIILGAFLARHISKRTTILWRDGVVGMLLLLCTTLIPGVGVLIFALLVALLEGVLALILFHFLFPKDSDIPLVE